MAVTLLERDQEVAALAALLDESIAGQGQVAMISGEAGIGKTALVDYLLARAPSGVRSLWGACEALFAPRPLGPFLDIAYHLPPRFGPRSRAMRSVRRSSLRYWRSCVPRQVSWSSKTFTGRMRRRSISSSIWPAAFSRPRRCWC